LTRPIPQKVLAVNKIGVHLSATATDDDSLSELGTIEKTLALTGIQTIETLETAALNYLDYCSRCSIAEMVVVPDAFLPGDAVEWRGETWRVEEIDHSGDRCTLVCSRFPYAVEIEDALGVDSIDLGRAIVAAIEKKAARLNNAARAQIVAQVDYETYSVHVQGEAAGKTRLARVDYQQGISYPPGREVLLVKPTGKTRTWEIVTRRHDDPTTISAVGGDKTVVESMPEITSFTASPTSGNSPLSVVFSLVYDNPDSVVDKILIDYDDGDGVEEVSPGDTLSHEYPLPEDAEEPVSFVPRAAISWMHGGNRRVSPAEEVAF
jgi:hypothetical protein